MFWIAALLLFAVATTPLETALRPLAALLELVYASPAVADFLRTISGKFASHDRDGMLRLMTLTFIIPAKKIAFLVSLATLLYWPLKAMRRAPWLLLGGRKRLWTAAAMSGVAALLIFPFPLRSLGDSYARMSISPFDEPAGILYRRILMPALAHITGMSGYAFYLVFALLVAVLFLYILLAWFQKSDITLTRLFLISMLTGSFFIYALQMPGYPDQLAMVFVMLSVMLPLSAPGRLSLAALALATHEASVLMLLPLAFFSFPLNERRGLLLLIAAYAAFVFAGIGFDIGKLLADHGDVGAMTPWLYFTGNPLTALAGVLAAYKLFWIVIAIGIVTAWRSGDKRFAAQILATVLLPLIIIPFAADTSRLAGFGFFGMLLAVKCVMEKKVMSPAATTVLALLNLFIPSVYVGLNTGVVMQPGLYKALWGWLF